MKKYKQISFVLILLLAFLNVQGETDKEIMKLEGKWDGVGEFLIPGVNTIMAISGKAEFVYNKDKDYLWTSLTGEKFLFKYSDSGHLAMDQTGDSLTWKVWDNMGKFANYRGVLDSNIIHGSRMHKQLQYDVQIEIVHIDSIDFRLTATNAKGESKDKAKFHLWRVK